MSDSNLISADQVVGKTLFTLKALPYYDGVPSPGYSPKQLGVFPANTSAGVVYSWIDPDVGRPDLWWMFEGNYGTFYYMPQHPGDFDPNKLIEQGAVTADQQNNPKTWYEKLLSQVLPVVVIAVIGAAAVKGYFSRKAS